MCRPDVRVSDVEVELIKGEKSILVMALATGCVAWYLTGAHYVAPGREFFSKVRTLTILARD